VQNIDYFSKFGKLDLNILLEDLFGKKIDLEITYGRLCQRYFSTCCQKFGLFVSAGGRIFACLVKKMCESLRCSVGGNLSNAAIISSTVDIVFVFTVCLR
jgi:hypothetical protein